MFNKSYLLIASTGFIKLTRFYPNAAVSSLAVYQLNSKDEVKFWLFKINSAMLVLIYCCYTRIEEEQNVKIPLSKKRQLHPELGRRSGLVIMLTEGFSQRNWQVSDVPYS